MKTFRPLLRRALLLILTLSLLGVITHLAVRNAGRNPSTSAASIASQTSPSPTQAALRPGPTGEIEDALQQWQKPSRVPSVAAFQSWAKRFIDSDPTARKTSIEEGVRLATERHDTMVKLIQLAPEKALESVVPEAVRRQLPAAIVSQLEQRVDGRGDLEVTAKTPGSEPMTEPGVRRQAMVGGQRYEAYVYGTREFQPTRWNIPLHGVAIDGHLALSELPGRLLEPAEATAAKPAGNDPVCSVSKLPTTSQGTESAVKVGDSVQFFCGRLHAAGLLRQLQESEALLPPGFAAAAKPAINAASGGNGVAVPNILPDGDAAWTRGNKRIVVVRVNFNGANYHDMEYSDCVEVVKRLDDNWDRWSYGRCRILPVGSGSHVLPILDLPDSSSSYTEDDISDIWSDAEDWADDQGYDTSSYDYLMVIAGTAHFQQVDTGEDFPPEVTWTGIGRVGGPYTLLRVAGNTREDRIARNVGVGLHELGHNLGLYHASSLFTTPKVIATIGNINLYSTTEEYGDLFDTMGRSREDYNVHYKNWLHWLDDGDVPVALSEGRYVIHEHDLGERGGGARGLQVPFAPGLMFFDSLFVEYRLHNDADPLYLTGPTIRLGLGTGPKTYLLDGRAETLNDGSVTNNYGTLDSQLPPGRTLSFTRFGLPVHITTLSADPDSGIAEVQVKFGTPAGNHAPTGSILEWSAGAVGQTVYFTADVSDADGDDLSFYWEVVDGARTLPTDPTIGYFWNTSGQKTIKCIVSDMHGGVVTLTHKINIVPNQPPTLNLVSTAATDEDTPISIDFTVSDPTLDPSAISTTLISSNKLVVPAARMSVTPLGGGSRRLTINPATNQHGLVPIYVTISDGSLKTTKKLDLTVRPVTPGLMLVAKGSSWSYWDQAAVPSAGWSLPGFRELGWKQDTARFVFNQGLFTPAGWTVLSNAPGRITTYFRRTFSVPAAPTGSLTLKLLCDDGAVVYLNGQEIWRQNMTDGTITPTTQAVRSIEGAEESVFNLIPLDLADLKPGALNSIAVEVHDRSSSGRGGGDVAFDAELALLDAPIVARMPNRTTPEDTVLGPINFTASDSETPAGALEITATSSDQTVIQDGGISVGYAILTGYRFTIAPRTNASGSADITLRVSDGSSVSFRTFKVTVTPVNDAPTLDAVPSVSTPLGEIPEPVLVHVHDVDNDPASLVVTATSGNPALVPNANITVLPGPAPDQRWLKINPTPGLFAQSSIKVVVSDGNLTGTASFLFRVSEAIPSSNANIPLLDSGAEWRFWAQALPLDTKGGLIDWTDPLLIDRDWPRGRSQLGYGSNGERTALPVTPYRVTTYFRNSFVVPNPASLSKLHLRLLRDDGAAVYLNGTRVYVSNLPRTATTPTTLATVDIAGTAEQTWLETDLDLSNLRAGRNVIAVEVHQSAMPSALSQGDLSFDLELEGIPAAATPEDILVPQGDLWAYWDSVQYPGDFWRDGSFPATAWPEGLARLGFGIGGITTTLADGSTQFRNPTVLLRHVFDVSDPSFYSALHLLLQRDDGAVVYLNGLRVLNDNVAATATATDWALTEATVDDQTKWRHFLLDPKALVRGRNLLAVELHQASQTGIDLNFDAQLSATLGNAGPPLFIRSTASGYELSWPSAFEDWTLRTTTSLSPANWTPLQLPLTSIDGWIYTFYPQNPGDHDRYFQLLGP